MVMAPYGHAPTQASQPEQVSFMILIADTGFSFSAVDVIIYYRDQRSDQWEIVAFPPWYIPILIHLL
jgi:hypothetical protein